MHVLDRKLVRDLQRMRSLVLAISLVIAAGVAVLVLAFGARRSLYESREAFYERSNYAQIFVSASRIPNSVISSLAEIPGVKGIDAGITKAAILDIESMALPAVASILSLPASGPPEINKSHIRTGRLPDPMWPDEVAISGSFADAHEFVIGSEFAAILNGRRRTLSVVGTLLSPEYIYSIGPGDRMPDDKRFGVIWLSHRAATSAFDFDGAFNRAALLLTGDANIDSVIDEVDDLLEPYGGTGAHSRDLQVSHAFLDAELKQLKSMSNILPPIFFVVAAFLVNMVIGRIVKLDREQIGLLKALGYFDRQVIAHYLKFVFMIAAIGIALGWISGYWLGLELTRLYTRFFRLPYLVYVNYLDTYAISAIAAISAAMFGAVRSVGSISQLSPATAMSPPAPIRYKHHLVDRLGNWFGISQPVRMILRSLTRWPLRTLATTSGIALSLALLIASLFIRNSLEYLVEASYFQAERQHASLALNSAVGIGVVDSVQRFPAVLSAEADRTVAVRLHGDRFTKIVPLRGSTRTASLSRVVDLNSNSLVDSGEGIVLSERLAERINVKPGDEIVIELLAGRRSFHKLMVTGTIKQYFGLGAYMDLGTLNRLLLSDDAVNNIHVLLDSSRIDEFFGHIKNTPGIASMTLLTRVRDSFSETLNESVMIMTTVYTLLAMIITFGVVYNSARIQLSERGRELASLRILGFSSFEVSIVLVGEIVIVTLLAIPIGLLLGYGFAYQISASFDSDLYSIPFLISRPTYGYSVLIVFATALMSALLVRNRLDSMDLVSVMKSRG